MISGLQFALGRKKLLPTSWGWLGAWGKHETPNIAPPLTQSLAVTSAGLGLHFCLFEFGILILVALSGLLYTAELFALRGCHLLLIVKKTRSC